MGGSSPSYDEGYAVAVDGSGNVYTTGHYNGTADFDPGPGVYNLTTAGIFVCKLDAGGNFLWARRMGDLSSDKSYSIATDAGGNVYVSGEFWGTSDFGPYTLSVSGGSSSDAFVCKLDAAGNFVWALGMGGSGTVDPATSVAVDVAGNVYATGYYYFSGDFDPGPGTYTLTSNGSADVFVLKLDVNGNFAWAKTLGGAGGEYQNASLALDGSGNIYVTSSFQGTADLDPGAGTYNLASAGNWDIFVCKLSSAGTFVWADRMGGSAADYGRSIAADAGAGGGVYTTGTFNGTADFNPGGAANNLASAGNSDVFLSKLDLNGGYLWARRFGGAAQDYAWSLAIDPTVPGSSVYIMGDQYSGTVNYHTSGTFNVVNSGTEANFIAGYDNGGNFICAMAITPGHLETYADRHLAVRGNSVWACASFNDLGTDFDPCTAFYNPGAAATPAYDIYVTRYSFASCNCTPLQAEWQYFEASWEEKTAAVKLQWSTASETNNDYFVIERSIDGKEFTSMGTVNGAGNSVTLRQYEFIDSYYSLPSTQYSVPNTLYYRLKQVDYDGNHSYSEIVKVKAKVKGVLSVTGIQSADGIMKILFTLPSETVVTYKIMNAAGSAVLTGNLGSMPEGTHAMNIPVASLPSGLYGIVLGSEQGSVNGRVILY